MPQLLSEFPDKPDLRRIWTFCTPLVSEIEVSCKGGGDLCTGSWLSGISQNFHWMKVILPIERFRSFKERLFCFKRLLRYSMSIIVGFVVWNLVVLLPLKH